MAKVKAMDAEELSAAVENVVMSPLEAEKITRSLERMNFTANDHNMKLFAALKSLNVKQRIYREDMEHGLAKIASKTYDDAYQLKKMYMVIGGRAEHVNTSF